MLQLERDRCPQWLACVNAFADERNRRGATPSAEYEHYLALALQMARSVDEGRASRSEALEKIWGPLSHIQSLGELQL